ncbi:hypothetical protein ACX3X3_13350 [Bacillus subtilis]|uniref:hypothetical protein n=1 Tax=Bacillus subtilis TaxID=1423 RepID=UPI0011CC6CE1|nr:hypothetical protein [Bacillus subtilis]TXK63675.1 hypothetical protein FVD40_04840 [Bacillus subtilis]HEQ3553529.1 hypothetical protein [Enterococcus faecalis]
MGGAVEPVRQERIFVSKLCKASQVSKICKKAKALFRTGKADDLVIGYGLMLKLAGNKTKRFTDMEVTADDIDQQGTT